MADEDDIELNIQNCLDDIDDLEKKIKSIGKVQLSKKDRIVHLCYKMIKDIEKQKDNIELDMDFLDVQSQAQFVRSYGTINDKLEKAKQQLQLKASGGTQDNDGLFEDKTKQRDIGEMGDQELIQEGDEMHKKMDIGLNHIKLNLNQADDIANDVLVEQDRQIKVIGAINENVFDIKSVLKRTKKQVAYFGKQVYKDRCLMCLIVSSMLAILIILMLFLLGMDDGQFNVPRDAIAGITDSKQQENKTTVIYTTTPATNKNPYIPPLPTTTTLPPPVDNTTTGSTSTQTNTTTSTNSTNSTSGSTRILKTLSLDI